MISDSEILSYCDEYLSSNAEKQNEIVSATINRLLEREYNHFSTRIVLLLRPQNKLEFAEQVVSPLLMYDTSRDQAHWELGYGFGISGQPHRAITYLVKATEAQPRPEWLLWLAVQYTMNKQDSEASDILEFVERTNPQFATDVAIHRQFFEMVRRFDRESAFGLLQQVRSKFSEKSISELEADIRTAVDTGRPYLLLRLGDGEGACIRLSDGDERANSDYYRANRNEFADIWFKDTSVLDDPVFIEAIDSFNAAIGQADAIGGSMYEAAIITEYNYASRRGIAWVVNVMRALLSLADRDPEWAQQVPVYSLTVHYDMLLSGALSRLLRGRGRVGLVSCHDDLPAALRRTYDIGKVTFIKTPGEQIHVGTLGQPAVAGRHWPDRFHDICAELDAPAVRNGELWLVAAGMLGKIYAAKLKARGAVVIDIGAVADLWMGKVTRSFPNLPDDMKLVPDMGTLTLISVGGLRGVGEEWLPHLDRIRPIIFEPNLAEAELVRAKIAAAREGLVIDRALGSRAERRTLHVTKSLGCTSLLYPNTRFLASYTVEPAFRVTHDIEIECVRFDSLISNGDVPRPDAANIEVQGCEYCVLEGFGAIISDCLGIKVKSHLYPIYQDQKLLHHIVEMLSTAGLILRRVRPVNHFDGDIVEVDAWFTCSAERAKTLEPYRLEKLNFIERVWGIVPRSASFGPDQFN